MGKDCLMDISQGLRKQWPKLSEAPGWLIGTDHSSRLWNWLFLEIDLKAGGKWRAGIGFLSYDDSVETATFCESSPSVGESNAYT